MDSETVHFQNIDLEHQQEQTMPKIEFSPDRNRFKSLRFQEISPVVLVDKDLLEGNNTHIEPPSFNSVHQPQENEFEIGKFSENIDTDLLQQKPEQQVSLGSESSKITNGVQVHHEGSRKQKQVISPSSEPAMNGKLKRQISTSSSNQSAAEIRAKGLLPPGRLAIPRKQNIATSTSSSSAHLHSQEAIPLVEWDDTGDSEEELSFFPQPTAKSRLTDNLSVDNLSLSGEEEDLHLSPPRLIRSDQCPCDPRTFLWPAVERLRRMKQQCKVV